MTIRQQIMAAGAVLALMAAPGAALAVTDASLLSPASQALFTKKHLDSIKEPAVLVYDFESKGTLINSFDDTVEAEITAITPEGGKDMSFHFLSGMNHVQFREFLNQTHNPICILFLERDVRAMEQATKGSALYFRNRIKDALAGHATVKDVSFELDGKTLKGTDIKIEPYADDPMNQRYPRFAKKTYEFILSDDVPGGIYKVVATTPNPSGDEPFTYDAMTFREMHEPDVKKAQAESPANPK